MRGTKWSVRGGPGFEVVEKIAWTIARHDMFSGGEKVVVAVSGGPDSTCLLHALARLGADLTFLVAHVDHGLTPQSEEIAAAVAREASEEGYDVHVARARDLEGANLHARARDFRYSFFEGLAEREAADKIATGHTLDDRVETTLARLIHGAGTAGLAGIPSVEEKRVRPLIDLRRAETRAYCEDLGLDFVDDPANEDLRFDRPRVRAEVLSAIESGWGEGAVRAIANSAERVREDAVALGGLTERLYAELAASEGAMVSFDLKQVVGFPRALRRRLLERAVGRVRDRAGGIEAALDALESSEIERDLSFAVVEGIEIEITRNRVHVKKPPQ
jgi:tRNA(Ile)-lysidine synthase